MVNCANEGDPEDGFDFFACPDCLDELEYKILVGSLTASKAAQS
jgi:hypothetical protein